MTYCKRKWSVFICAVLILMLVLPVQAANTEAARRAIRDGFDKEQERIELSDMNLTVQELLTLTDDMKRRNEWPWYVDSYSYSYHEIDNSVTHITPDYLDPKIYDREVYGWKLQDILEETVYPGMSKWQIALAVHDYLAVHYVYDESLVKRDAYDLITNGVGVCEGYSAVYQDLMELVGVECILATSEKMNHVWNMVRIDGTWYHVDLTWDDPTSDCTGRAMHSYFLLSDSQISDSTHNHHNWDGVETADDSQRMANAFWNGITSQICYESAAVSYFRQDEDTYILICRRDESTGKTTQLAQIDSGYVDIGTGKLYHYTNYGLSLWNGKLYFSDMEHVYSINPDGTGQTVEYTHDAAKDGTYIKGSMVDNGMINLTLSTHDGKFTWKQVALSASGLSHQHDYKTREVYTSCTEEGYVLYTCECGDSFAGEKLSAKGHRYDAGVPEGTDQIRYTCTFCGESYVADGEIPPETAGPEAEEDTEPPEPKPEPGKKRRIPWFRIILIPVVSLLIMRYLRDQKRRKLVDEEEEDDCDDFCDVDDDYDYDD